MAYSKEKLKPSNNLVELLSPIVFKNVRSTSEHKTSRVRQCYACGNKINKNDNYINHQFKYDGRIITISFCVDCFNENQLLPNGDELITKIHFVSKNEKITVINKYSMNKIDDFMKEFPRRNKLYECTPSELAISKAIEEVEKIGAHVKLTEVIIKLIEARELVSDFTDDTLKLWKSLE